VRLAWKERVSPLGEVSVSPRVIGAVARELRARRRRRVVTKWVGGTLVSAATATGAVVLTLFLTQHPRRVSTEASGGAPGQGVPRGRSAPTPGSHVLRVSEGMGGPAWRQRVVAAGDDFRAPASGPIRIVGDEGSELVLEPGGELRVVEADATRKFELSRGAVHAHVKKLLADERFIVGTPEAEVEVHGTQFRVSLDDSRGTCLAGGVVTRVSVSEGVVTVTSSGHEERLLPGDHWSSTCPLTTASDRASNRASEPGPNRASPSRERDRKGSRFGYKKGRLGPDLEPTAAGSTLAAQNDLFSSAVRARRNGRHSDALQRFERFVREYPSSPLVESAIVNRMRLLHTSDHQAAADAATEYLSRFPDGFARAEAQTVLSAPPTR
jgi:hypothetical protein